MKFLRVIRFDQSDDHVFERAAPPNEWAVSGAIVFQGISRDHLKGKLRQAFANGVLGIPSMGRSTFASVAELDDASLETMHLELARGFVETFGAPTPDEALKAAGEEIAFARDLCRDRPVNTVFTVRRVLQEDGQIREEFREISPPTGEPNHARIWEIADD